MSFWKSGLVFLFAFLLVGSVVFADEGKVDREGRHPIKERKMDTSYGMEARYEHIKCQVDYSTRSVDSIVESVPGAQNTLASYKSIVTDNLNTLKGYLDSGNKDEFNDYLKNILKPNMQSLSSEAKDSIRGVNGTTRSEIRGKLTANKQDMASCNSKAMGTFGQEKVAKLQKALDEWTQKIANLSSKGIDTSKMTSIVGDAKTTVIDPLSAAVATGDAEQVRLALHQYCLGNGCEAGINFHFYAKINIARLEAIVSHLENSNKTLDQAVLVQVKADLSEANIALSAVGTSAYTDDSKAAVWDNIKEASEGLRQLLKGTREVAKNETKKEREIR